MRQWLVRALLLSLVLTACGRLDFQSHAAASGDGATPRDGTTDTKIIDAAVIDAPSYCESLDTVTPEQCAAAFANPSGAIDQVVYDCALNCELHECVVRDTSTCTSCACMAYADSWLICTQAGNCSAPLSGTGCIGDGFYAGAPFDCTSANGLPFEGACIIRYLITHADC